MHYAVLVITPDNEELNAAIESAMSSYQDVHWDWYQVGGRWTGFFDGYDPEKDPANLKPCEYCNATGTRSDSCGEQEGFTTRVINEEGHPRNGQTGWCNGCNGTGQKVEWPTSWGVRDGDTIPLSGLTDEHLRKAYAVCVDGYGWMESEEYVPWKPQGERFQRKDLPPLEWLKTTGGRVTIVDCHN